MEDRKRHHWPKEQCYYCGNRAVAWCDGINHFKAFLDGGGVPRIMTEHPEVIGYCDRPLCEDHCTQVGMSTASGSVDSIDYCPKHMTKRKLKEEPDFKF